MIPDDLQSLVQAVDAPDRDTSRQLPIVLLQHNSVEKLEANPGSEAGGWLIPNPRSDDILVIAKAKGFKFIPFAFEFVYYVWD